MTRTQVVVVKPVYRVDHVLQAELVENTDMAALSLSVCGDGWFILWAFISQFTTGLLGQVRLLKPATNPTHTLQTLTLTVKSIEGINMRSMSGTHHGGQQYNNKYDLPNMAARRGEAHRDLTNMVVTMSVLLASVSETLMSRLLEFMARVLLENQTPI